MDVPMELSRIVITELGDQQVIFLKEIGVPEGGPREARSFPILIGISEALAIDRRLKGLVTPRPMTHELLAAVIESLGGTIEKIVINDLRNHTFYAQLCIRQGGRLLEIDSRPSDAIALGSAMGTPIFVAEHVLESVLREPATREERIELLRQRLFVLRERIDEVTQRLEDENFVVQAPQNVVEQHRKHLEELKGEYDAIHRVLQKLG